MNYFFSSMFSQNGTFQLFFNFYFAPKLSRKLFFKFLPKNIAQKLTETHKKIIKQAGTVLGQAQLELKLTSFTMCCIKLIILVKLC